ncbi:MAG: DUF4124 domain-containing protein [Solimonas sp.]
MLAGLLFGFVATSAADEPVYRYVDADGVVHYTDRAPDRRARPIRLAPVPGSSASKKAAFYGPETLRQAVRFSVRVESPTPDQRLSSGNDPLVAAASVMPALVKGFHLVYQVDGHSVMAAPVDELSIALQPLTEGSHELQVILLDDRNHEVARSEASRFWIAPPQAAGGAPKKG